MHKDFLQKAMGAVFLSAAAYRIINFHSAIEESSALMLPSGTAYLIIVVELIIGGMLFSGFKARLAASAGLLLLGLAVILAFVVNRAAILMDIGEIFIFDPVPTDILLHCIYIFLLLMILRSRTLR